MVTLTLLFKFLMTVFLKLLVSSWLDQVRTPFKWFSSIN